MATAWLRLVTVTSAEMVSAVEMVGALAARRRCAPPAHDKHHNPGHSHRKERTVERRVETARRSKGYLSCRLLSGAGFVGARLDNESMTGALVEAIRALSRGVDDLLPFVREPAGDAELIAAQRALQTVARKVYAAQLELDAATEHASLSQAHGYPSVKAMLGDMLRLHPREAAARETHREQLAQRRSLTGEILPPRLPATAAALAQGTIGAAYVEVVEKVMQQLPNSFDLATCTVVEEQVAKFARDYSPRETGVLAGQLLERLDPDGPVPEDRPDPAERENLLFLGRARGGRLRLRGEFGTEGQAAIRALLDALAKPHPPVDGIPDERSLAQRQGDALVQAAHQVLGFGTLPDCAGERPQVVVTVGLAELEARLRAALLDFGAALHPEVARMLACDSEVIPVVLGTESQPLDVGRASRSVPTGMRRALIARAGGHCEMPGCDRPASWCDAHHCFHWAEGCPTKLANLALLCRRHHRLVHKPGWEIRMDTDGHPVFTPPALIDPHRTPRPSRLRC